MHPQDGALGPIFLVGSQRSGSTMLRLIIDSHPNIAIGAETGFMGAVAATRAIPGWRYGSEWFTRIGWTSDELDHRLCEFYSGMFGRFAAQQGKVRWGEKTPFHTSHIPAMADVFPDAVFVGIIRHPGAVSVSLRDNFNYTFERALSYWSAVNTELLQAATHLGARIVLCRYEDLVIERETVLRELLGWLGEPWAPTVLEHHRVQQLKGTPRLADGSTRSRDPVDARRAHEWVNAVSDVETHELARISRLAMLLGYDVENAEARAPMRIAAVGRQWLPDGNDVARLLPDWLGAITDDTPDVVLDVDADPQWLAERLSKVEQALERMRSRKSVLIGDAVRRVQHGRSWEDVRSGWRLIRSGR